MTTQTSKQPAFKKGAVVSIINCDARGVFFVEGRATVVKPAKDGAQSIVRFMKGEGTFERFIDPAAQTDPESFVHELNRKVAEARAVRS